MDKSNFALKSPCQCLFLHVPSCPYFNIKSYSRCCSRMDWKQMTRVLFVCPDPPRYWKWVGPHKAPLYSVRDVPWVQLDPFLLFWLSQIQAEVVLSPAVWYLPLSRAAPNLGFLLKSMHFTNQLRQNAHYSSVFNYTVLRGFVFSLFHIYPTFCWTIPPPRQFTLFIY